jgi:hypothetical protein
MPLYHHVRPGPTAIRHRQHLSSGAAFPLRQDMRDNPIERGLVSSPGDLPWSSWGLYFLQHASVLRFEIGNLRLEI